MMLKVLDEVAKEILLLVCVCSGLSMVPYVVAVKVPAASRQASSPNMLPM